MAQEPIKVYDALRRARRLLPPQDRGALAGLDDQAVWTLAVLVVIMAGVPGVNLGLGIDGIVRGKVAPLAPQYPGFVQGAKLAAAANTQDELWAAAGVLGRGISDVGAAKVAALVNSSDFAQLKGVNRIPIPQVSDPPLPAAAASAAPAPVAAPEPPPPAAAPEPPAAAAAPPTSKTKAAPAKRAAVVPALALPSLAAPQITSVYVPTVEQETVDQIVASALAAPTTIDPPSPDVEVPPPVLVLVDQGNNVYTGPTEVPDAAAQDAAVQRAARTWDVQEKLDGRHVLTLAPPPVPRRMPPPAEKPPEAPSSFGAVAAAGMVGAALLLLITALAVRPSVAVDDGRAK